MKFSKYKSPPTKLLKLFAFLLVIVCQAETALSQNVKTFEGTFLNEQQEEGRARFGYYETNEGKIIKDGPYSFEASYPDSLPSSSFIKKKYEGKYEDNFKEGQWTYKLESYRVSVKDVNSLKAQTAVSGNKVSIRAHYKQGVPTGQWTYETRNYDESSREQIIAQGSATFDQGRLTGPFYFQDERKEARYSIRGNFNSRGYMDSTWVLHYQAEANEIRETRLYQHGFLLKLTQTNLSTGNILREVEFKQVKERLKAALEAPGNAVATISEQAFPILFDNGYYSVSPEIKAQLNGNNQILKAFESFFYSSIEHEGQLNSKTAPILLTARFYYPIRTEEKKAIVEAVDLLRQIQAGYEKLPVARLELKQPQDDSLAFMYVNVLHLRDRIQATDSILRELQQEETAYIDRTQWLNEHPLLLSEELLRYTFRGNTREVPVTYYSEQEKKKEGVHYFVDYLKNLQYRLNKLSIELGKRLETVEQNNLLRASEVLIFKKIEQADSLFTENTPAQEARNSIHSGVAQQLLQNQLPELMQRYSETSNFKEKQKLSESMVQLLNTAEAEFTRIARIPKFQEELDRLYSRTELDPYTFNENFKVRIKRRLYEPAAEIALPFLTDRIRTAEDYRLLEGRIDNLIELYDVLRALREDDTKRLERRLKKRQDDPEKILRQLGVELAE